MQKWLPLLPLLVVAYLTQKLYQVSCTLPHTLVRQSFYYSKEGTFFRGATNPNFSNDGGKRTPNITFSYSKLSGIVCRLSLYTQQSCQSNSISSVLITLFPFFVNVFISSIGSVGGVALLTSALPICRLNQPCAFLMLRCFCLYHHCPDIASEAIPAYCCY